MPIPVQSSHAPMVFDALPAYKVRYYHGKPAAGKIYCYMRLYHYEGGVGVGLYSFERDPSPASHMGLAIEAGGNVLYLCVTPQIATIHRLAAHEATPQLAESAELLGTMPVGYTAGTDEQGWYWGAQLSFSKTLLAKAGVPVETRSYKAALYKYHMGEKAWGVSVPVPAGHSPLSPEFFDTFVLN